MEKARKLKIKSYKGKCKASKKIRNKKVIKENEAGKESLTPKHNRTDSNFRLFLRALKVLKKPEPTDKLQRNLRQ